jgi:hypothetical protein
MMSYYHYLGKFQLYESCKCPCFSYLRRPCKIIDRYFDCQLTLVGQERLNPGESGEVQVTFLCIDLVSPLIQIGDCYEICEGSRPIGEIVITQDPWIDISAWISEGEIRQAVVGEINWTTAGVILEGGIASCLMSQDMGLQEWEEIGQVLNHGDIVKVCVEKIDKVSREIKVSFLEKILCQDSS